MFIEIDKDGNILGKCSKKLNENFIEVDDFEIEHGYDYKYVKKKVKKIPNKQIQDDLAKQNAKNEKKRSIAYQTVTTINGNEFQADEESQNRMMRAILSIQDDESINWKLSNNDIILVTKQELQEALKLSVDAQSKIWLGV